MSRFEKARPSTLLKSHQPCVDCGSSDALAEYSDGHTYCFSCGKNKKNGIEISMEDTGFTYEYLPWRGITRETMAFYDVKTKIAPDGKPAFVGFPYGEDAYKIRSIEGKQFSASGKMAGGQPLFGMDRFGAGSAGAITITEGELDAMSAFQILGSKYPSVSVRGASSAGADCKRAYEYLNSFEKIYLCFDNDGPGSNATSAVARLFNPNKVFHVQLDRFKDANEYLTNDAGKEFTSSWWNAGNFLPKGVKADYNSIESILRSKNVDATGSYPFPSVQDKTYGPHPGEIVLVTAQEGVGKTEVLRAMEHHLLKTTDHNIAIIHLEEQEKRSVQGLVGYELSLPVHLPDTGVSIEDQILAFRKLTGKDNRLYLYSHFGSDDPDIILDLVRYLAAVCGCKHIFLDHITMVVTGHEGDDERKKLDYLSTRLATLTRELEFTLFLVSHVNDDGKTRGSRNISKVADLWLALDRNTEAGSNTTTLTIRKNRFTGKTGPTATLVFDPDTYKLSEDVLAKTTELSFSTEITPVL